MTRKNTGLPDFMDPSMLHSFVMDDTLIIPFHTDSDAKEASGPMDAEQFPRQRSTTNTRATTPPAATSSIPPLRRRITPKSRA